MSFEIDHVGDVSKPPTRPSGEGWIVSAFGRLRLLTDEEELVRVRQSALRPWAHDDDRYYLRVDVATLNGRRFT